MTQYCFEFIPSPSPETEETRKWVENHNQQVLATERTPSFPSTSLLSAIDIKDTQANAIYLLRSILGKNLRKSLNNRSFPAKKSFIEALQAEISIKKTNQNSALTVRQTFLKNHVQL